MKGLWILTTLAILFFILLLVALDLALIPAILSYPDLIDVMLVVAIFLSIVFRYEWGLGVAVMGGLIVDALLMTGAQTSVTLVTTVLLTNALFRAFFTNRSLWTLLILGGVGTVVSRALHAVLIWSYSSILAEMVLQLVVHSIAFSLLFFLAFFLGTRLRTHLLVHTR